MNFFIKILTFLLTIAFLFSIGRAAIKQTDEEQILKKDISVLRLQIFSLKKQINQVEKYQDSTNTSLRSDFATYSSKVNNTLTSVSPTKVDARLGSRSNNIATRVSSNETFDQNLFRRGNSQGVFFSNGSIDVGNAPAITTQGQITYLGSYSGNNTIPLGQISKNLYASTIIGQRDKFPNYSMFFGGYFEGDAQTWFGSQINRAGGTSDFPATGQNIYMTTVDLYFLANVGEYMTAVFDFLTDDNSDFGLRNGFVILGNLDTSPFFVTVGKNRRISVGTYGGGGPWSNGLSEDFLAPGSVTNISLNYKTSSINANITTFGTQNNHLDFSAAIFYANKLTTDLSYGLNFGYIFNLAGADNTSISKFLDSIDKGNNSVGTIDIDGTLAYSILGGVLQFQSGWSTTTNKEDFNKNGTSVNTGAWYFGLAYGFRLYGRNTNFNFSYSQSYNAANIPMSLSIASPNFGLTDSGIKKQIIVSSQRSYFDNNVLIGPEYSYQSLYNGEDMNTLTLDLSVYI
ncbi:DUF3573 domain-containing protein [Francisella tularensis]|uniref:DUF3573 domain-containing protein n=1 Tax=Francisella tularensis TaxID=263 RepID=UPI001C0F0908|nr:DUF3573 domain-containing protein [Francisella tularensis]MBK2109549.1 DUF3573 domain-containing protein [Francisella tularensis subsp. novicida FSC595]